MIDLVPLVNKNVEFAYRGARLSFDLSHGLFSSYAVDVGTRFLLKEIAHDPGILEAKSILDSGCGTGIIGISLAASLPGSRVVMRDRDLLACAFAERNCWRNGIAAIRLGVDGVSRPQIERRAPKHHPIAERASPVLIGPGLLGLDDAEAPYEAVITNIPAKAGESVFVAFFESCSGPLLRAGGRLAFVIVNTLADAAHVWAESAGLVVESRKKGGGHTVFLCRKPDNAGAPGIFPDFGCYVRGKKTWKLGRYSHEARGFRGLPEFDTPSFATLVAIEAVQRHFSGLLVGNLLAGEPGIGLSACHALSATGAKTLYALSRDYLSLEATKANVRAAFGEKVVFEPRSILEADSVENARIDAAIWFPDTIPGWDAVPGDWEYLARTMKKGGRVVIAAPSHIVSRYDRKLSRPFSRIGILRRNGFAALVAELAG